jgi:hypothetical protein
LPVKEAELSEGIHSRVVPAFPLAMNFVVQEQGKSIGSNAGAFDSSVKPVSGFVALLGTDFDYETA